MYKNSQTTSTKCHYHAAASNPKWWFDEKCSVICRRRHVVRCDDTRGCVLQFWPPDDVHMCSKHVEAWNKLIIVKRKLCASSWLITEINEIELFEFPRPNSVRFLFVGFDEEVSLQKKGRYTRMFARSHCRCHCRRKGSWKTNSDQQHAIFAHELRSAMRLTLGIFRKFIVNCNKFVFQILNWK